MSGSNEEKKVLLAGLPNSGLSTIKAIIDNNPPKELKPIIQKLNIGNSLKDLLHGRLFLIRCGGNESINDLLSPTNDPLFKNVEALVYILDLAEQANYSIARYWFEAIKNHIHKFSPNARIFIFLHKTDLLEGNKLTNYISAAKNLFNEGDTEIYFHETSVYDASIFMAFRDVLLKEMDEKISVKQYFSQALKDSNFACLAVFSKDGL
ncbi:MAG: ADP-ribosylation factor-like protein, partial [Asgard group archaeon]|nr:ADP-ribosylation factor-like protein [Asgard group archaeon]